MHIGTRIGRKHSGAHIDRHTVTYIDNKGTYSDRQIKIDRCAACMQVRTVTGIQTHFLRQAYRHIH
jgi:hypothetical protein